MIHRTRFAVTCLLGFCLSATPALAGSSSASSVDKKAKSSAPTPAPEFGPSVVYDRSDVATQLSDLRGKMVVVVFFQSWCPICNGWSPAFLKQMDKAFGDDPSVALVAIKVDGGTPTDAKAYLKAHGADVSKWIVASDTGGTYYQRSNGTDTLWGYALIDDQGHLLERGKAGSFFDEPAGKRFVLADPSLKRKGISSESKLSIGADAPPELMPVVKAAQAGKLVVTIRGLRNFDHGKLKEPAQKLQTELVDELTRRVEKASTDVKSEDPETRYRAYQMLDALSTLSDLPPGQSAKKTLAAVRTDKAFVADMSKQAQAESAFWSMVAKSVRLDAEHRKTQLPDAMKQFAGVFAQTAYAERAMNEADTIASGTLAK